MSHGAHAKRFMAHTREGSAHASLHSEFVVPPDGHELADCRCVRHTGVLTSACTFMHTLAAGCAHVLVYAQFAH